MENGTNRTEKVLIICYSYHHHNTEKIAKIIAEVINADLKTPDQIEPEQTQKYDLIGFASGIYSAKLHLSVQKIVEALPQATGKKAFIFSTAAITNESKMKKDHRLIRQTLLSKGFTILNEFQCKGFNTNSFLKYFGGMNKKRPNAEDFTNARKFAENLKL